MISAAGERWQRELRLAGPKAAPPAELLRTAVCQVLDSTPPEAVKTAIPAVRISTRPRVFPVSQCVRQRQQNSVLHRPVQQVSLHAAVDSKSPAFCKTAARVKCSSQHGLPPKAAATCRPMRCVISAGALARHELRNQGKATASPHAERRISLCTLYVRIGLH